ncbi:SDR family NAD(P)-dependent oxidoreductase [Actinocorallia longicatena]|uniref:SDR family oxidoreductase n=1 Tax=Actinocorallia longicatena TaxID=111803 RepID=A0ABP6QFK8_9ACTN
MSFEIELDERTALVTGAGQGVGKAVCMYLAAAGAKVLVNDVSADRAEAVANKIRSAGGKAEALPFDVSDFAAASAAIGAEPALHILVNNAGNAGPPQDLTDPASRGPAISVGEFMATDPADWDRYFAVNLFGVMNCTHAALPKMREAGEGRIITIISDAGRIGEPNMAPYAAAKAGAAGFSRALAREVGGSGITVNNVALATVDTVGLDEMARSSPQLAERFQRQLKRYIVPRFGRPADVAGLVLFLASSHASWISGQTYPVNGGYSVST